MASHLHCTLLQALRPMLFARSISPEAYHLRDMHLVSHTNKRSFFVPLYFECTNRWSKGTKTLGRRVRLREGLVEVISRLEHWEA